MRAPSLDFAIGQNSMGGVLGSAPTQIFPLGLVKGGIVGLTQACGRSNSKELGRTVEDCLQVPDFFLLICCGKFFREIIRGRMRGNILINMTF